MSHHQTLTNANYNHSLMPDLVKKLVADMLEEELKKCLWYRIECCGCDAAAEKLGKRPDTIRDMIKRGDLAASKIGNDWCIRLVDIDAMLKKSATVVNMPPSIYRRRKKNIHQL